MKIEDVEKGMKVKCKVDDYPSGFSKGDILTVEEIKRPAGMIKKDNKKGFLKFEEYSYWWNAPHFEPVNKFEVGDELVLKIDNEKVYYCGYMKDGNQLVETKKHGNLIKIAPKYLSKPKKPDELQKGDKFKSIHEEPFEVVAVGDYEDTDEKTYFAKTYVDGEKLYYAISSESVDEIIY